MACSDFGVQTWADLGRTIPRTFRSQCRLCHKIQVKEIQRQRRGDDHEPKRKQRTEEEKARLQEIHALGKIFSRMSKEDRWEYQLKGCLPFASGFTLEDLDPTPVPQGCPGCYLRGGMVCVRCPDEQAQTKARAARKEGRIIGNAKSSSPVLSVG